MCGIFGYINFNRHRTMRDIVETLLQGLQQVEYRGYDSAGVCVDNLVPHAEASEALMIIRSIGNVAALKRTALSGETYGRLLEATAMCHVGIAHTRWATHGEVSLSNCHPQRSNDGHFAVVHNGMMTNFMEYRQMLLKEGYHFRSNTDTEVIGVLAEHLYNRENVRNAVELGARLSVAVEGAYAFLLKSSHFPDELIALRKGAPLVVGHGVRCGEEVDGGAHLSDAAADSSEVFTEVFFASDYYSFAPFTKEVVFLEEGDLIHYEKGRLSFYSTEGGRARPVDRPFRTLHLPLENFSKGAYEHFMLKEIFEQGDAIRSSLRGRVLPDTGRVRASGFTEKNIHLLLTSRRLLLVACGTSLHSCLAVRPLLEELLEIPIGVENAADMVDRCPPLCRTDACLFVSQSGETADTLMALAHSRACGAVCVGVTNIVGSSLSRQTDFGIHLKAGAEIGVASTKVYTCQVVVLTLIALLLSEDRTHLAARRRALIDALIALPNNVTDTLRLLAEPMQSLACKLHESTSLLIMGRGYDFATALEAALKVKELTYMPTEGFHAGELKHGALALIDEHSRVLSICSQDAHFEKTKTAVQQVSARRGRVVVVTNTKDDEIEHLAEQVVRIPATVDALQGVLNIIPFQLLAYHMARMRGHNVDCPRNLSKSVTVQ